MSPETKAAFEQQLRAAVAVHGGVVKERTKGVASYHFAEYRVTLPGLQHYLSIDVDDEGDARAFYSTKASPLSKRVIHHVPVDKPEQMAAYFKGVVEGRLR